MLRTIAFTLFSLFSFEAAAEMLEIEKRSHTINGVSSHYVLEVDVEDIKKTPKLDPIKDEIPMSMNIAIKLAVSAYMEKYESDPWRVGSVSLDHFPSWDYRDRWHYKVDIFGNPHVNVVVLFNEKVIFPRKQ